MTPGAAQAVLTNGPAGDQPGIYYNLAAGDVVYITCFSWAVLTVSDNCYFELGYTDAVNGAGTFYPRTQSFYLGTGANIAARTDATRNFSPYLRIRYADGARSIAVRVDANDAGCAVQAGYQMIIINE